jgi:hypothetical protein
MRAMDAKRLMRVYLLTPPAHPVIWSVERENGSMATVPKVCQTISEGTSTPRGAVDHLARRLGEAELLPRGPRGRNAPHFNEIHEARLLVGVMAIATNGINYTSASVVRAVKRIEELSQGGEARVDVYVDRDLDDPQSDIVPVPAGSFVDNVAWLIRLTQAPSRRDDYSATAIGLTFGGDNVYGWIEYGTKARSPNRRSDIRRVNFGLISGVLKSGMKQEVRIEADVLFRLGELLDDTQLERQPELLLQEKAAPKISKTTTPAAVGTGPAHVDEASQPGANPVNPADLSNQQDSDEKERGQSPAPSSSLGSPSSGQTDQLEDETLWPNARFRIQSVA